MTMQTTGVTATEAGLPKHDTPHVTGHVALPKGERLDRTYLVMLLPGLALFTLFITVPALVGIFFSFTNYAGLARGSSSGSPTTSPCSTTPGS